MPEIKPIQREKGRSGTRGLNILCPHPDVGARSTAVIQCRTQFESILAGNHSIDQCLTSRLLSPGAINP